MKNAILFGKLAVVFAIVWGISYYVQAHMGLLHPVPLMMIGSWGFGLCVVLAIVFFVLRR
jgi:hypothetical protein